MNLDKKHIFVFGLLVKCPEGEPVSNCPLQKYRVNSLEDRLDIAMELTESELDKFILHHDKCVKSRVI